MVSDPTARSEKPPLNLATSPQDLFEREEICIELVRSEAERGNLPMPESIVPRKRWWGRNPARRTTYDRPTKKTIHALAEMHGQSYRTDIMAEWVSILYGASAGLHYSQIAESLHEQQAAANKYWLELNPDGPLPTRRPVPSDWLTLVGKELPSYDSDVQTPTAPSNSGVRRVMNRDDMKDLACAALAGLAVALGGFLLLSYHGIDPKLFAVSSLAAGAKFFLGFILIATSFFFGHALLESRQFTVRVIGGIMVGAACIAAFYAAVMGYGAVYDSDCLAGPRYC